MSTLIRFALKINVETYLLQNPNLQSIFTLMIRNSPELIIFDWSGTLSDDRRVIHEVHLKLAKQFEISPISDFHQWLETAKGNVYEWLTDHKINITPEEAIRRQRLCIEEVLQTGLKPSIYEGVSETLQRLLNTGRTLAVISGHPQNHLEAEAQEYGIHHVFRSIEGGTYDKTRSIIQLCESLGYNLGKCVYVGDMVQDIQAAKVQELHQ